MQQTARWIDLFFLEKNNLTPTLHPNQMYIIVFDTYMITFSKDFDFICTIYRHLKF